MASHHFPLLLVRKGHSPSGLKRDQEYFELKHLSLNLKSIEFDFVPNGSREYLLFVYFVFSAPVPLLNGHHSLSNGLGSVSHVCCFQNQSFWQKSLCWFAPKVFYLIRTNF